RVSAELLGVPEDDRGQVLAWVDGVMYTFSGGFSGTEEMRRGEAAVPALMAYFAPLVRSRRAGAREDALSAMLQDPDATDDDVITLGIQFLMGVYETVRHVITVGMLALLRDEQQVHHLRQHPALASSALEELLRYDGISPTIQRIVLEDLEIDGHLLR